MTSNSKVNQVRNEVSDVLFSGVRSVLRRRATPLSVTMTDLEKLTRNRVSSTPKNWPASASAFRVAFNRVVNRLRHAGVSVRFKRANDNVRTRLVVLTTR